MNFRLFGILFFLVLFSCENGSNTGSASVELFVSPDSATIGDIVTVQIQVEDPERRNLVYRNLEDGNNWEVKDVKETPGSGIIRKINFNLVFWDTGRFLLPPIHLGLFHEGEDTSRIISDSASIFIQTVLSGESQELKPIKGPVPLRWTLSPRLLLSIILIFLLIVFIWLIWKKRIVVPVIPEEEKIIIPVEDPIKRAFERLSQLENDLFIDIKEGYFVLTHILRELVEGILYVRALEMTTNEIIENKHLLRRISDIDFKQLIEVLTEADQVKFASFIPEKDSWKNDKRFAKYFITQMQSSESLKN